jgi:hypothetical protein
MLSYIDVSQAREHSIVRQCWSRTRFWGIEITLGLSSRSSSEAVAGRDGILGSGRECTLLDSNDFRPAESYGILSVRGYHHPPSKTNRLWTMMRKKHHYSCRDYPFLSGARGLCLCWFDMMIDTPKMCLYGTGGLLRRDSRDMIFLFGDKVCSEGGGGRTVCHLSCSS